MVPRRRVEEFISVGWTRDPGQDGANCVARVKLNGEDEAFSVEVPIPGSVEVTISHELGHPPSDQDLEAIAKAKVVESVSNGLLDHWLPTLTCRLSSVDYREVERLVDIARRSGFFQASG